MTIHRNIEKKCDNKISCFLKYQIEKKSESEITK